MLSGSIYERYYGIDYAAVAALPEPAGRDRWPKPSDEFAVLCRERAGAGDQGRWSVAHNGTIIEQAQILTTHNLATLAGPLGLGETTRSTGQRWPTVPGMGRRPTLDAHDRVAGHRLGGVPKGALPVSCGVSSCAELRFCRCAGPSGVARSIWFRRVLPPG